MTQLEFQPAVQSFLAAFFGPGNLLLWSSIETKIKGGKQDAALMPWIQRLADSPDDVTLLPRPTTEGTTWYGLGHSFAQAEQLREELLAAVGPTYSDFTGYASDLDLNDSVERAVAEFTGGHAFRLCVPANRRDAARSALERLRGLWEQRPPHIGTVYRSVGRVMRDFELALTVHDLTEARSRLDEMRTGGMLDARNLLFQEIRFLAAGERWSAIMALDALPDIAQIRCPVVVADAVLQALYAVEFSCFEEAKCPAEALEHFRAHALGRWASFFRVKSTIKSTSALKLFMMLAVSATPLRAELREAVLAEPTLTGSDRAYCEALSALVTEAPTIETAADPFVHASTRYDLGDYDGAFPAALEAQPSAERLRLLLNCAVEIATLEATTTVLRAFADSPTMIRDEVLASGRCRVLWQHLIGATARMGAVIQGPPTGWLEWLERLSSAQDWPDALSVAEQGAREWDPAEFVRDGSAIQRFRTLLGDRGLRNASAQGTLRDALPFLIAFLTQDTSVLRRSRGLLEDLLLLLTDDAEAGAADMTAIKEVIGGLIDLGPAAVEYCDLVGFLRSTWDRFGAPRRIDWLLDAMETLVVSPAPAPEARILFAECVFAAFARWRGHVGAAQWRLLGVLCGDLGLGDAYASVAPTADEPATNRAVHEALRGRTIVIHSLMEKPALHARDALLATYAGAEVVLNADHVATPQLRELARQADLFVVVYRAAKHAATGCIEAARPKNLPLLRPDGRSATAIVREVVEWCNRNPGQV